MPNADACAWMLRFKVSQGDITKLRVDAIVNSASESLLGNGGCGGVDGAIHRAAGPKLFDECKRLFLCPTGTAKLTGGYNLPAKRVIHTVGPKWKGGGHGEDELLKQCYQSVFALVEKFGLRSLSLPAISCGEFGYPLDRAANIAVTAIRSFLDRNLEVQMVHVVCHPSEVYDAYLDVLQGLVPE